MCSVEFDLKCTIVNTCNGNFKEKQKENATRKSQMNNSIVWFSVRFFTREMWKFDVASKALPQITQSICKKQIKNHIHLRLNDRKNLSLSDIQNKLYTHTVNYRFFHRIN